MESVILFDPGIRSLNKGDEIIMDSAEKELKRLNILENRYVLRHATHAPVVTCYQNTHMNPRMRFYDNAKYKFICGSNLLWKNMLKPRPVFNVNLLNCMPYKNSILFGVGTGNQNGKTNWYTKKLYRKILSYDYVHSVRDNNTKKFVEELGFKAINTGCPTMWRFTKKFCHDIPVEKSENVIFTLTDYGADREFDQQIINILVENYKKVYFWIQGAFDKEYLNSFENIKNIVIIPPDLSAFSKMLSMNDVEYVGTRLHAGMYAMQHKKRTIIITIDHRVRDMNTAYAINTIERDDLQRLEEKIYSHFTTDIKLNEDNIQKWTSQFKK